MTERKVFFSARRRPASGETDWMARETPTADSKAACFALDSFFRPFLTERTRPLATSGTTTRKFGGKWRQVVMIVFGVRS